MPHVVVDVDADVPAEPRAGGRSHIRVVLDRRWKGTGRLLSLPVALLGRQMFKRNPQKTLDVLATGRR